VVLRGGFQVSSLKGYSMKGVKGGGGGGLVFEDGNSVGVGYLGQA